LTENALAVLRRRYLRKGPNGEPVETVEQMFHRVASHVAAVEEEWGGDVAAAEAMFYDLMTSLRFLPNSPTFTGAGTPLGQLAACFCLPISDDMGREPDGIFQTLRDAALIQQTGGGNGFSFSRLRPKGAVVRTSGGQATGPVGFLRVFDKAFGEIAQGGSRRGANMAVLRVDHPDIREFIACKSNEHAIANFNISIGVTNAFMRAVEEDGTIDLVNPQDGEVWKTVRAQEIFGQIVAGAHRNGEPGMLFLDTANRDNPCPHLGEYEATNPCVTGDTLVATPQGWQRVDEVHPGDAILTIDGVGYVERVELYEARPIYRVRFSDGRSIQATAAHQFYVSNPTGGSFEPRRLDTLRPAARVQTLRPGPDGSWVKDVAAVISIKPAGIARVYDLYEPRTDTWVPAGYISRGCGEQFLLPYENCCLGSVNLARHVQEAGDRRQEAGDRRQEARVDWERLKETVECAVRFLDDVIQANSYVPAVPQLEEAAHRTRRIGLGIMGLGDLMIHLRVRYGSDESLELAAQVMEFIRYHAMRTSIELARERGPFPAIGGSVYDPDGLRWTPPQPLAPYTRLEKWGRPVLDWGAVVAGMRQHGIRNAAQLTVAPTGTVATVAGCEAYGCEPVFALAYTRHVNDDGQDLELRYVSPLFLQALEEAGLDEPARERIVRQVLVTGSCQNVEEVPPAVRDVFVVAGDISAEEHVCTQATLQAFVDASISKTINFPATATQDNVARAFQLAWKLGCKGLTVYVTGSREKVVLETEATRQAWEMARGAMVPASVRPRPHRLEGCTYRLGTPLGTAYITVNTNGDGEPFEVFLNVGKAGSDTAAVAEAIGRLISLVLRIPSPLSATRRLKQVMRQLKGIGGGRPLGFGPDRVRSLPDGVAQVLAEHLGMVEPAGEAEAAGQLSLFPAGDLCPECGHAALVSEEGCRRCYACGYSEC